VNENCQSTPATRVRHFLLPDWTTDDVIAGREVGTGNLPVRAPATVHDIAQHEAAHAVMRCLRGLPATAITARENGGLCAGTGDPIHPESELLVSLAGYAWQTGYLIESISPGVTRRISETPNRYFSNTSGFGMAPTSRVPLLDQVIPFHCGCWASTRL
jgi:hypothetical protein